MHVVRKRHDTHLGVQGFRQICEVTAISNRKTNKFGEDIKKKVRHLGLSQYDAVGPRTQTNEFIHQTNLDLSPVD